MTIECSSQLNNRPTFKQGDSSSSAASILGLTPQSQLRRAVFSGHGLVLAHMAPEKRCRLRPRRYSAMPPEAVLPRHHPTFHGGMFFRPNYERSSVAWIAAVGTAVGCGWAQTRRSGPSGVDPRFRLAVSTLLPRRGSVSACVSV